jgi:hypothetical protein
VRSWGGFLEGKVGCGRSRRTKVLVVGGSGGKDVVARAQAEKLHRNLSQGDALSGH